MKATKFIMATIMVTIIGMPAFSQTQNHSTMTTIKTEFIKVSGNCGMCKTRIEGAAMIEGVSEAEWNEKTDMLTLVYDSSIVTSDDVQKEIASVGHDTEKFRADDKVYDSLPGCCKYR